MVVFSDESEAVFHHNLRVTCPVRFGFTAVQQYLRAKHGGRGGKEE